MAIIGNIDRIRRSCFCDARLRNDIAKLFKLEMVIHVRMLTDSRASYKIMDQSNWLKLENKFFGHAIKLQENKKVYAYG